MQLAANGMLQESNPRTDAIVELLLGAPVANKLTDIEEPGDKAVAELNVLRIQDGQEPFFKPWMNHEKHISVLLENMRDPKFFLEFTVDQQSKLEQLLQRHQSAIAPNQAPMQPGMEQPGGGVNPLELLQGEGQEGAPPSGPAMAPAIASGFAGDLGGGGPPQV